MSTRILVNIGSMPPTKSYTPQPSCFITNSADSYNRKSLLTVKLKRGESHHFIRKSGYIHLKGKYDSPEHSQMSIHFLYNRPTPRNSTDVFKTSRCHQVKFCMFQGSLLW